MQLLAVDHAKPVKAAPLKLFVRLDDGAKFELEAIPGRTLLDIIEDFGLPVRSEPSLVGPATPGHIRVPFAWRLVLPQPSLQERSRLSRMPAVDASSRLADEIVMRKELDGIEIALPSDSLIPQTNWVAG